MTGTCFVTDLTMLKHWNVIQGWNPEKPQRLEVTHRLLTSRGLVDRSLVLEPRFATDDEIALVHTDEHIARIRATDGLPLEEVTVANYRISKISLIGPDTNKCARLSTGCLLQVVDAVLTGKSRNGVALIRPPGHHSSSNEATGFCMFNNVAVAAKYAIREHGLKRILIFDWDIHHGNGTQTVFYKDASVLYVSLHRYSMKIFPRTEIADATFIGDGDGKGYNINIPWTKPAMTDADYLTAMHQLILPVAYEFNPELVIISAGFDSAKGDLLGDCCVTPAGYQHMTSLLRNLAGGKLILQLEGGYNVDVVAECMAACMATLLGDPVMAVTDSRPSTSALASIKRARTAVKPYWKCLTPEDTPIVVEPEKPIESLPMPIINCCHEDVIRDLPKDFAPELRKQPQWICLTCYQVLSGDFDSVAEHADGTQHFLAANTQSLRVWCSADNRYALVERAIPALAWLAKNHQGFPQNVHPNTQL
ncbi:histone deacetylase 6 [Ixodes scapularis]